MIILITCLVSIVYTVMRYHLAGPVPWKDFFIFTLNKGVALSAFVLLILNFSLGPLKNLGLKLSESVLNSRKSLGMTGFLLALIHVFISFLLFKKEVYGQFFMENGTLTLYAGLSMLGGILSFVILWAYNLSFQTYLREDKVFIKLITSRNFLLIAMLFGMIHVFFMGVEGWMRPNDWHGGLPPISLVSFVLFLVGYVINLFGRK